LHGGHSTPASRRLPGSFPSREALAIAQKPAPGIFRSGVHRGRGRGSYLAGGFVGEELSFMPPGLTGGPRAGSGRDVREATHDDRESKPNGRVMPTPWRCERPPDNSCQIKWN
jgi:hypothetical protein